MPEIISTEGFLHKVKALEPGDVAHHSMLYPGVYPSDAELQEHMRAGGSYEADGMFHDGMRAAIAAGVRIEWLCTLPRSGESERTDQDIRIRRRMMGVIASYGADVRIVQLHDVLPGVIERCGDDSPVVQDFLHGLETGDPRKSSWTLLRRQQAGQLAVAYVDTMDYQDGEFLGRQQQYPRDSVDPRVLTWTAAWRDVYANQAERL